MSDTVLRVTTTTLVEIRKHLSDRKKIAAIKILRTETGSGLKEAKQAVDRIMDPTLTHLPRVITLPCIKSVIVDMGEGDVKMDLDKFNMLTLMNMQSVGIEDTRRLLDLYDLFRNWEQGSDLENEEEEDDEG